MRYCLVLTAMIAAVTLSLARPAEASFWDYGCKGTVRDTTIAFDLNSFLIMPGDFAKGDITGLAKGRIYVFEYEDKPTDDWGVTPKTFTFIRGAYPDQKVVLTEKSIKVISRQNGHLGTRETTTARYRATYHYQRLGWEQDPVDTDVVMDCFEKQITAPS